MGLHTKYPGIELRATSQIQPLTRESRADTQLQQEGFHLPDDGRFKIALLPGVAQAKEVEDVQSRSARFNNSSAVSNGRVSREIR